MMPRKNIMDKTQANIELLAKNERLQAEVAEWKRVAALDQVTKTEETRG